MAPRYCAKCVKFIMSRALRPTLDRAVKCKNTLANRRKCCSAPPATSLSRLRFRASITFDLLIVAMRHAPR